MLFARRQLENCLKNTSHDCHPQHGAELNEWPSRILEISEKERTVKLVAFNPSSMVMHYTALSYCWGSKEELERKPNRMTTKVTHDTYMATGIPIHDLPLTIRQAVWITQYLGQRYIWVDSLCIIQDDNSDWEVEALKMATVYSMATVTIIAASSTSCHSGFRHKGTNSKTAVDFKHLNAIDQRGWTYQEEHLSTRYLKFTEDDIQWECSAGTICFCGEGAIDQMGRNSDKTRGKIGLKSWNSIVRGFSGRAFTKQLDKLPAISGLARRYAEWRQEEGTQSRYIAGCWEDRIKGLTDLVWEVEGSDRISAVVPSPMSYIAPSFAWPSVNMRVHFHDPNTNVQPLCEVVAVRVHPMSVDKPYGMVSDGELVVRGPL
ncbi:heterokaryon incompatibility protein-domain-containing protein, partial [Cercophora newfieldiana]